MKRSLRCPWRAAPAAPAVVAARWGKGRTGAGCGDGGAEKQANKQVADRVTVTVTVCVCVCVCVKGNRYAK